MAKLKWKLQITNYLNETIVRKVNVLGHEQELTLKPHEKALVEVGTRRDISKKF
jgi:hypothetical protein